MHKVPIFAFYHGSDLNKMEDHKARTIVLPIGREEYQQIVGNKKAYRKRLSQLLEEHPEIFPEGMAGGFSFSGCSRNMSKQPLRRRLVRLKKPLNPYADYLLHPCFCMPYMRGVTAEVSEGLLLRKYNLPYHAIARTFGRNAMYWYEAEMSLSRYNIVGTTFKRRDVVPADILVDEHHTSLCGQKAYVCTTVGADCFLGAGVSPSMEHGDLMAAYGGFKRELLEAFPGVRPASINTDGYKSTKKAAGLLFPGTAVLRCFLHSFLKVRNCGTKAYSLYFGEVAHRVWHCYRAGDKRSFSQRVTHLENWAGQVVPESPFKRAVLNLCKKKGSSWGTTTTRAAGGPPTCWTG